MTRYVDDDLGATIAGLTDRVNAVIDAMPRTPSKAAQVGNNRAYAPETDGEWLTALVNAGSRDARLQESGKATLEALGSAYVDGYSKATLGETDANGGYIVPNNLVDELAKTANYLNPYRNLLTVRSGITSQAVDLPYRSTDTTAAAIHVRGSKKENKDLAYANYSATMYVLARIYDLGNAFIRQSAGAAERDVISELGRAFALGESHYVVNGTGTGEPFGIIPAIVAATPTYDTVFTGATTLLGSIAAGIATAAGNLAVRNQRATAAVMNPADYWLMFRQGADTAGFYAPGPYASPFSINVDSGTLAVWGIPVIPDNNVPSDTCIVGNFRAATLFVGMGYRIESSSVAADRFDMNETGFRGELEIGFDARPAVAVGAFERITDLHA